MIFLKQTKYRFIKVIALCLVLSLTVPVAANAATVEPVTPLASYYLSVYNSYVCSVGFGRIEVWFDVMGTGDMDEIGALSIKVYESTDNTNWKHVQTYLHETYSSMLTENNYFHCSSVSYQGVRGRYYKAHVCIWAGKNGGGDSRYIWTSAKQAA